jgi:hypothetical protein
MINLIDERANIGELACVKDTRTGDYSLSLHDAIAKLSAENERLQITIDDLLNKIECLRCGTDLHELGFA